MSFTSKLVTAAVEAGAVDQASATAFVASVAPEVMTATAAADAAVIATARSIADFVEGVSLHNLPLPTGLDEIGALERALASSLVARRDQVMARVALLRVPKALGLDNYGPHCPCANGGVTSVIPTHERADA